MKFLTTMLISILLFSCSKESENFIKNKDSKNTIEYEPITMTITNGVISSGSTFNYGDIPVSTTVLYDINVKNNSSLAVPVIVNSNTSGITYVMSPTTQCALLQRSKTCKITVSYKAPSTVPVPNPIIEEIVINNSSVAISGNVVSPAAPIPLISVPAMDLGTYVGSEIEETFQILNQDTKTIPSPGMVFDTTGMNPDFSLDFTNCQRAIGARSRCDLIVSYNSLDNTNGLVTTSFKIFNQSYTVSVLKNIPILTKGSLVNFTPSSGLIDFGDKEQQTGDTAILTMRIKNTSGTNQSFSTAPVLNNFILVSNGCTSVTNRSYCYITLKFNSDSKMVQEYTEKFVMENDKHKIEFDLRANVVANSNIVLCDLTNAVAGGGVNNTNLAVSSVSGNFPLCSVTACQPFHNIASDLKSCEPVITACSASDATENGWNTSQTLTLSGNKTGADVSNCSVATCNNEYSLNAPGKTCDEVACSLTNSQGNGVSSILNVASVSGTINNDSCLVTTCDQYYKNAFDNKSCSSKLCTELNGTELTSLGYNLTGATISGTHNTCTVTCTSPLQQLAIDGKSCEDRTPTGTISFAQDYTKILAPNVLNITSSNAQSIQFYSDAGCVTTAGAALALPLVSINLTLSPTDGVKNVYAKIFNGSKSSACLTDNIILDQTAPVLAVTAPLLNANIAGDSLIISGTCSELNAPTVSISVTLNSVTQNVSCSSGTFSTTFNITALSVASYNISLSATDLAGNVGTGSSLFNRINCTSFQDVVGNSCEDKIPTGSIVFQETITNFLTENMLNLTQANAQSIQFYSDTTCQTINGSSLAMPLSLTPVTLSGAFGIKTIYAKFINGTKSSNCLSASINYQNPVCTLTDAQSNGWNITNAQTASGLKDRSNVSACVVSNCITNFSVNTTTKACVSNACSLANAGGNGVTSILNVATVSGNIPNCLVATCSPNYKPATDNKSCIPKLCTELNASELSVLGISKNNGTISGTYPSCSLTCNSSFELSSNGKSCLAVTYQATFSAFGACSVSQPCEGQGTQVATKTGCQKFVGGQPVPGATLLNCSKISNQVQACFSPPGSITITPFDNGTKTVYCSSGQTESQGIADISCNQNFIEKNGICFPLISGWKQVAASKQNLTTCGVTTTGQAFCWGQNYSGQLGIGITNDEELTPLPVNLVTGFTSTNISSITVGNFHTCAVTTTGQAFCWGQNSFSQLGDGTSTQRITPRAVSTSTGLTTTNVASISAGQFHTCAVTTAGRAYCWGAASDGSSALGNGSPVISNTPLAVSTSTGLTTTNVTSISTGYNYTCARTTAGRAYCWGDNTYGQLGDGTKTKTFSPIAVVTSTGLTTTNVASISSGYSHSCAVTTAGRAYCWGENTSGGIGDNTQIEKLTPTAVNTTSGLTTTNVASISAGFGSTCSRITTSRAYCWGLNGSGEVGDNSQTTRLIPTAVNTTSGLTTTNVASISTGRNYNCALTIAGRILCWGYGGAHIGNGTYFNNAVLIPEPLDIEYQP